MSDGVCPEKALAACYLIFGVRCRFKMKGCSQYEVRAVSTAGVFPDEASFFVGREGSQVERQH